MLPASRSSFLFRACVGKIRFCSSYFVILPYPGTFCNLENALHCRAPFFYFNSFSYVIFLDAPLISNISSIVKIIPNPKRSSEFTRITPVNCPMTSARIGKIRNTACCHNRNQQKKAGMILFNISHKIICF